ncbi:MAG: hypothetical protein QXH08_00100 [Candidatus Hadarchaeales archaeon]
MRRDKGKDRAATTLALLEICRQLKERIDGFLDLTAYDIRTRGDGKRIRIIGVIEPYRVTRKCLGVTTWRPSASTPMIVQKRGFSVFVIPYGFKFSDNNPLLDGFIATPLKPSRLSRIFSNPKIYLANKIEKSLRLIVTAFLLGVMAPVSFIEVLQGGGQGIVLESLVFLLSVVIGAILLWDITSKIWREWASLYIKLHCSSPRRVG